MEKCETQENLAHKLKGSHLANWSEHMTSLETKSCLHTRMPYIRQGFCVLQYNTVVQVDRSK